jgi:hypothetical protein
MPAPRTSQPESDKEDALVSRRTRRSRNRPAMKVAVIKVAIIKARR